MSSFPLGLSEALVLAAFSGTSFTPDRRGRQVAAGFQSELDADIETLKRHAEIGGTADKLADEVARYAGGYRRRVLGYLQSSSRCVSSVIAGPSNFPARRMNKRAEIAHRRMEELSEFRERALKAAIRNLRPDLRPIMSGDADAVERLEVEVARAERNQQRMKVANAAIRKHAKSGPDHQVAALLEQGFTEAKARELLTPDAVGRIGFADYALTNNNSNIRRMKERIARLKQAKAAPVVEHQGAGGIRLEDDPPANRVRLFFPGKPDDATREQLKANGFRWAPTLGAWQSYRNNWSLKLAKKLAGLDEVQS